MKSGEQLDADPIRIASSIMEVGIIKRTERTFRKVGLLTLSLDEPLPDDASIPDASLLKWTPGKRAQLEEDAQVFDWLNQGWIMKEMRFKRDGKTIERVHYRMGYRLFAWLQQQSSAERQEQSSQLQAFQEDAACLLQSLSPANSERAVLLSLLISHISSSTYWTFPELTETDLFPRNWSALKRIQFFHFTLAFILISGQKEVFDWKEIGAQYYRGIGGSKAFDAYKDDFLRLLEQWGGQPAEMLGLISPGQITPLYFAGQLSGQWSSYHAGPVHALTDLSIAQDQYRTEAGTLWLVENRAILTRITAERGFLQETGSLMACVDGHIRSSHRRFIQQLLNNSGIRQVIFWSDYDPDGLLIAAEMLEAVSGHPLTLKWIGSDHQVMTSWAAYEQHMKELLQQTKLEQEQVLGGAEDWRRWINL